MLDKLIIVRYGEIGVKSPKVRGRFERKLIENIKTVLPYPVDLKQGRIFIYPNDLDKAVETLKKIPGIVSYSPAAKTKTKHDSIKELIEIYIAELVEDGAFSSEDSFAIRCRRVGEHDFTSQEMAAYCGSVVNELTQSKVDLSYPDFELFVEVRQDKTYIYHQKIPGLGGLPVGTQGKVVALVSSGIDSPVATFLMMKRGCSVTMLNFNNYPYTSGSNEKILKIYEKLKEYSAGAKLNLYQVDYGEFLRKCIDEAPDRMTCVLCKSGMYKIAEKIAQKEKALAIIDGSSLGQVASQTLPNILATRHTVALPVLSPLIGLDKVEIENIGKNIGTYDISILPDSDCFAVPKHPETNAELCRVLEALDKIDAKSEFDKVIKSCTLLK
ncbi:tRNA uracil 4-sulfurtransferase ThiI [Methanobacterium petrolearium]|uniref:tRNA uracil 4-sulfurtransferase ThiI n=1 Tax=Methanobacterium petrolearium TaxID=710190 RepID=UPI001AEB7650|nr:tRNA uracil 4-sulfurtransferase ThiI [Methanobacterium petrolearium]MBP1945281.1 thiamine biosynthesis protein ThiI [Methanobacterium petrolearium]BDZ71232.1 tRNA 4-thiouridine(8) synthase ThiI [Methanobacterium petrolearium]